MIALVGAESTGKSSLAQGLSQRLGAETGWPCTWVPEYLREWCDAQGRTPRQDEQAHIADEQARRIDAAAATHALVLADTTPLMTAVYHHQVFGDDSLDAEAQAWQRRRCDLTLLTALDLPWVADGLQRDGPHVREPVDARLRGLLISAGLGFSVVAGQGEARLDHALDTVISHLRRTGHLKAHAVGTGPSGLLTRFTARDQASVEAQARWSWPCDCDVPECEHAARQTRASGSLQRR